MALLTTRDRIAIVTITAVIVTGWGIRLALDYGDRDPFTVHHGAVPVPEQIVTSPTVTPDGSGLFAPININTATAGELAVLPMIGTARAAAIIAYRDQHGLFHTPEELTAVSGIGPGILARIREDITIKPIPNPQTALDSTIFGEK